MPKGHKPAPQPISPKPASAQPADCREALHWFVNNVGLYSTSPRGLIATDFGEEHEALLEQAIIDLKSRGINPVVITGDALYRQGEFLWEQAVQHTRFGRPLASQFELELTGADVLILRNVEAPEAAHHLWYLYHQVFYPRALAGKPLLMTSPLGLEEFNKYGAACDDFEFAGRKVTWQKLTWLMEATCIDLELYRTVKDDGLPPMLKAEHVLYKALKERELPVVPQHVLGDYQLDLAMIDRDRRLDIECDVLTSLDSTGANAWQAKKNLLLLNDGWKVLKFTSAEIISNTPACIDVVEEVWTQGRKRSSIGRLLSGQATASIPELPVDDDVQRLVITHGAGPCAVEGGAGTGKSSCVIHRVAYLLAQGINPDRILVISHSQDTVKSLKTAVEAIADRQAVQRVSFHSWHDLGLKILKENLGAVKRKPPLKVESNPQKVIQRLLSKHKKDLDPVTLELSEELDEFTIASLISLYKANLITPKHLKERAKSDVDELVCKVFQGYEDQLQKINRIDRDDMVSLAAHALVDNQDLRLKYQLQYDYVLVDEYQDATAAGDLMARILAAPQDNLYLTGDEDEAIYESKGGLPRLMADVSIRLPNARCYILEKNWRCHPAIVDHTHQLIANLGRRRIQKDMASGWGAAPTTAIIGPQFSESEQAEAEWVADEISILIDSGRNPQDIAVLYRYHRYGIIIEEALSRRNIRCVTSHPEAGLIPDEVGDVMAFLKLVMDPDGPKARESFERVCQLRVKEVDPKLSSTIASFAEANNLSYLKAVEIYSEAVAEQSCLDLSQLVRIIRTMHQENLAPAETISLLKRTQRLADYYRAVKVPPGVNYEPLKKLATLEEEARKYKTVSEFVKAQTATPAKGSSSSGFDSDHVVHILTLHEAKGKEFSVAFLVGLAEGLFPADSAMDLEEERRLCYVGMTRAKELLYLSFPSIFNNVGLQPSSFLVEARLMAQQPMHIPAPTLPPAPSQVVAPVARKEIPPPAVPKSQPAQTKQSVKEQPVQQPVQPALQQPVQPSVQQPVQQPVQPSVQQPVQPTGQPSVQQPVPTVQPTVQRLPVQQPLQEQPVEQRVYQQPVQQRPVQQQPVQQQPVQQQPVQQQAVHQQRAPQQPVQQQLEPQQPAPQKTVQQQPAQQQTAAREPVQPQPVQPYPVDEEHVQQKPKQRQLIEEHVTLCAEALPDERALQNAPANSALSAVPALTGTLSEKVSALHKTFQNQLIDRHTAQQKEIAAALAAAETAANLDSQPTSNAAKESTRPGRKTKAELAQDAAQGLGPVQAALQRRNKLKQQQAEDAAKQSEEGTPTSPHAAADHSASAPLPVTMAPQPATTAPQPVATAPQSVSMTDPNVLAPEPATSGERGAATAQPASGQVNVLMGASEAVDEYQIIRADLSIAHDQIAPDPTPRFTGTPPAGKKRNVQNQTSAESQGVAASDLARLNVSDPVLPAASGSAQLGASDPGQPAAAVPPWLQSAHYPEQPLQAQSAQNTEQALQHEPMQHNDQPIRRQTAQHYTDQPIQQVPSKLPEQPEQPAALAESLASSDVSDLFPPAPETHGGEEYSSLNSDVPPGVVLHRGPVSKKRKEPRPFVPEDPNQPPMSLPADETELVASYDYTLPPDLPSQKQHSVGADEDTYTPPSQDEQEKMYAMFEPPPMKTTEELLADAWSQPNALDEVEPPSIHQIAPNQPHSPVDKVETHQLQPFEQNEWDLEYETPSEPAAASVNPEPLVEDYNYTAPHDPAALREQDEDEFEHRPRCNGCGTFLEVGSQFCGECGYRLEARIPGCHLCGSPLEPSAKFCGECGSKRVDSRPHVPMPQLTNDQVPDMQSPEYEAYVQQQKPTQRNWVVKLLKILET